MSPKSECGYARDGHLFFVGVGLWNPKPSNGATGSDINTRVKGGAAKEQKVTSTARKQVKQLCAMNKQFLTPLAATLAGRS